MFSKNSGKALGWLMFVQVCLTTVLLGFALIQASNESRRAKEATLGNRMVIRFLCAELEAHRLETETTPPGLEKCDEIGVP